MRNLFLLALPLLAVTAKAQSTTPDDPISSVRPSFSDSPTIVPVRHLQIEYGLSYFSPGRNEERSDFGEVFLRYGLRPRLEFRVQLPNYDLTPGGHGDGFDNTSIAVSYYLGKALGFDLGVIPTLSFPTGARGLRYDGVAPAVSLNAQRSIGGGNTFGGTLFQSYGRQDDEDLIQTTATLNAVHPFSKSLAGFVEYGGFFAKDAQPVHYAHLGVQLLVSKTSQFDIHGGFGLGGAAAHEFIGAGYSVRF